MAEQKAALVVAAGPDEAAQAVAMSQTLLGLGFDVIRLDAPETAALEAALAAVLAREGPAAIYSAGLLLDLENIPDSTAPRFIFSDHCVDDVSAALPDNLLFVAPDGDCSADVTATVQDWMTVPGLRTDQWDDAAGVQVRSSLTAPFVFRQPTSDVTLTAEDYALLDTMSPQARARMISLWRGAGIAVDVADSGPAIVAPVPVPRDTVRVVAPVQSRVATSVVRPISPVVTGGGVARAVAPATPVSAPQVGASGLPIPSILVGFPIDASFQAPQVPEAPVAGSGFETDNIAAREALRVQDAALFAGLVETGAFDPPEVEVVRALQVELARVNCYTAGIDGAWGPGSQRALAAFYEAAGQAAPDAQPDLADFRVIVAADGVRCPDVVVAQPVAQSVVQPAAQAAPAQPRRVATPAPVAATPAPAAQTTRRSINQTGGSGIFR